MANYAEEALRENDPTSTIISVLEVLSRKSNYGEDITELTDSEKIILLVGEVETEVNNGGFSQYFFNRCGKHANEAVNALEKLDAMKTAALLREAIAVCAEVDIDEDDLSEEQEDKLNKLDSKFYKYEDDLSTMQINYIKAHVNEFR